MLQSVEVKINKLYFAETIIVYKYLCTFLGHFCPESTLFPFLVLILRSFESFRVMIVTSHWGISPTMYKNKHSKENGTLFVVISTITAHLLRCFW